MVATKVALNGRIEAHPGLWLRQMEAVIADAGPLVAYICRDDKDHEWAEDVFHRMGLTEHIRFRIKVALQAA